MAVAAILDGALWVELLYTPHPCSKGAGEACFASGTPDWRSGYEASAVRCEPERLDSTQRKRKVRLYFITQILCLFPVSCSWAWPVMRSKEEHCCGTPGATSWAFPSSQGPTAGRSEVKRFLKSFQKSWWMTIVRRISGVFLLPFLKLFFSFLNWSIDLQRCVNFWC